MCKGFQPFIRLAGKGQPTRAAVLDCPLAKELASASHPTKKLNYLLHIGNNDTIKIFGGRVFFFLLSPHLANTCKQQLDFTGSNNSTDILINLITGCYALASEMLVVCVTRLGQMEEMPVWCNAECRALIGIIGVLEKAADGQLNPNLHWKRQTSRPVLH